MSLKISVVINTLNNEKDIKKSLLEVGWPEKDINEGFLRVSPVAVSQPTSPPADGSE